MKPDFPIAKTANQIAPFRVMSILATAKQLEAEGRDIIHMEIGEPDFPSLACVHQAAFEAAEQGFTHYTPTLGLPQLRQALSDFYQSFYHAQVSHEHIVITPGSSSALQLALTAIINPHDKVLMADPSYPCNRQFVSLLQATPILLPVHAACQYQLTLAQLKAHWQPDIKAVMVASPANPTGTLIEQDELVAMAHYLAEKNAYLIVDEIYQGLVYERPAESILANHLPNNVIVINSFSKFFGMTGWRLGWSVAPEHLVPVLDRLGQNLYLSAPTPSQYGALAVLQPDALAELELRRQIFEQRRNDLITAMQDASFKLDVTPQGAFYLYWDVSEFTEDSEAFCQMLLEETGVALTPGTDFGLHQAHQRVRLAYTNDSEKCQQAITRIHQFLTTKP